MSLISLENYCEGNSRMERTLTLWVASFQCSTKKAGVEIVCMHIYVDVCICKLVRKVFLFHFAGAFHAGAFRLFSEPEYEAGLYLRLNYWMR